MTAIKIENIKCELTEDERWRSYFIKAEDVKCKFCSVGKDRVKVEPLYSEFTDTAEKHTKYSCSPPKTPAERKRAQREREKQLRQELGLIRAKGPPKSAAERKRAQREREKQMRMQIALLYPKRLEKIPGESRKERIEREKQIKLELGLISPKGPPKTAAERKRAQREREKQMKLEVGLVSLQATKKVKRFQKEKQQVTFKSSTIRMRDGDKKYHQKIDLALPKPSSEPKTTAQQEHQQFRKELKPLGTNTPNVPTEIKLVLKSAEWYKDHILKYRFSTGENIKPIQDLEFIDCGKVSSTDNSSVLHFMEE